MISQGPPATVPASQLEPLCEKKENSIRRTSGRGKQTQQRGRRNKEAVEARSTAKGEGLQEENQGATEESRQRGTQGEGKQRVAKKMEQWEESANEYREERRMLRVGPEERMNEFRGMQANITTNRLKFRGKNMGVLYLSCSAADEVKMFLFGLEQFGQTVSSKSTIIAAEHQCC